MRSPGGTLVFLIVCFKASVAGGFCSEVPALDKFQVRTQRVVGWLNGCAVLPVCLPDPLLP